MFVKALQAVNWQVPFLTALTVGRRLTLHAMSHGVPFQQMHPREAAALRLNPFSLVQCLWTMMSFKKIGWPIAKILFLEAVHERP